ncbi:MAG: GNAT family N-acetyltransferase [Peptococcaceae bacterium]|nr:GNAT family N-acetyltransferase [Peptococcaceae bacterium]
MDAIKLVTPCQEMETEALDYRKEHYNFGEKIIHGSSLFDQTDSYDEWLRHLARNSRLETVERDWVVSTVFFGLRERDGKIIGVIELRHELNDFLREYGGHIGYAVRPSERGKGYATEMIRLMLAHGKSLRLDNVMISCYKDNLPSARVIEKSGGVLARESTFTDGKPILVYWVNLTEHLSLKKGMEILIRGETPGDYPDILGLTYEAFLTLNYPGRRRMDEHFLISLLQGSDSVIPELCFVAVYENEIAGHILYAKSSFLRPDGSEADTITFGPLSVLPRVQRQGIGEALVRHSLEKARRMSFGAVQIMGVPDYYPKLGFKRAREFGLALADGSAPDAFMAYELAPGHLAGGGVHHRWAPEYDIAENDDAGYERFHHEFIRSRLPHE